MVAGQTAALALKKVKRSSVRKGMVLVDPRLGFQASWDFEADIAVLTHSTTIQLRYQARHAMASSGRGGGVGPCTASLARLAGAGPSPCSCTRARSRAGLQQQARAGAGRRQALPRPRPPRTPHPQAVIHCEVVRQSATVVSMDRDRLRSGDKARVRFRFLQHPEYLSPGARFVFREGRTRGVGVVAGPGVDVIPASA